VAISESFGCQEEMKTLSFHLSKILAFIVAEKIWDLYTRTSANLGFVQCILVRYFKLKLKIWKAIKEEPTCLYYIKIIILDYASNWALKFM